MESDWREQRWPVGDPNQRAVLLRPAYLVLVEIASYPPPGHRQRPVRVSPSALKVPSK